MRIVRRLLSMAVFVCCLAAGSGAVPAADWPQWRGPRGDGISPETGLLDSWPESGPEVLWRAPLGAGFSAISVVGEKGYTMFGDQSGEYAVCFSTADGKTLWKTYSGELLEDEYGDGPRATPTVNDGRVYTHGATGSLLCLDAETGEKIWGFNTLEKFSAENVDFGLSASPAIFGDMVVVVAGTSSDGKSLAALDKTTGDVLWTSLSDLAGYSTPIRAEVEGVAQIIVLMGKTLVSVSPQDGRELWRHPWITTLDANVATPIFHEGKLFISTGYGTGCGMFSLRVEDGKPVAEELWASRDMKNYFSTSVLYEGHIYGFNSTILTCLDFETGEPLWRERGFNRGSLLVADGRLIILGERGDLALAKATSEGYQELGKFQLFEGKSWTVPTLADGKLFVRNEEEMVCLKVN